MLQLPYISERLPLQNKGSSFNQTKGLLELSFIRVADE